MRPFTLPSVVVASVVFGLVTLASSSASAAPAAAGKRAAKRAGASAPGAPARVLPAPQAKPEPLPQLPPVARDVTAMTTLTSASIPEASNAAWGAVLAPASLQGGTSEPLAPLPATPTPAPAREVLTARSDAATEVKPNGFVIDFGMGALVPATSFVSGVRALGPGISFDARLGYYVTPHVGVVFGVRGSYGHQDPGCSGDSCNGYSLQVPVMVQFAGTDRARGVYVEVGIGLGTTYGASTDGAAYKLSSPAELKLGLGYRFAGAGGARRTTTLDLNIGADIGSMKSADIHTDVGSYSGSVDGTTHVVMALSVISHFSL